MYKIGIFITARLGSSRLPKKHIQRVNDRPILEYLIERIEHEFEKELQNKETEIIICTSTESENEKLRELKGTFSLFFGDSENIPNRHYQACLNFQLDAMVSVDGDDILCSPQAMRSVFNRLKKGEELVRTVGLPLGLNVYGYSRSMLENAGSYLAESKLETGWTKIFANKDFSEISFGDVPEKEDKLRFTLDYKDDLSFFKKTIEGLGKKINTISDFELVDYVLGNEIFKENAHLNDEYWANFQAKSEIN